MTEVNSALFSDSPWIQSRIDDFFIDYEGEGGTFPIIDLGGLYVNDLIVELLLCLTNRVMDKDVGENIGETLEIAMALENALKEVNTTGVRIQCLIEGTNPFPDEEE